MTLWTVARQAPLSLAIFLVCSNSVMLSNHLILCPFSFCLSQHQDLYQWVFSGSLPESFPASGSFQMSQFFTSDGQSVGTSASASILPVDIQGWCLLGLTGLISLLSKGLSRVFSSTTIRKHQFFSAQPSLWSSPHIHTWLLEKPELWRGQPDVSNQQLDWSSFCFSESRGQIPCFILSTVKSARL